MKLLIYLLLLLTMPLAAQGKTDEKTLLDCIDKMIEREFNKQVQNYEMSL